MKKMTCFVMALAMALGFTQCKKEQANANSNEGEGNKVAITLKVNGGNNNGSRVEVYPPHVWFESGDVILVASEGRYVGQLEYGEGGFSGEITNPRQGEPLYFYFLGNKAVIDPASYYEYEGVGAYYRYTVDISDQTDGLPVISYGKSEEYYPSLGNSYTATLNNMCALVRFDSNVPFDDAITITINNMMNKVVVDFRLGNGGFSFEKISDEYGNTGKIKLHPSRWAILLPDEGVDGIITSTATTNAEGYLPLEFTMGPIDYDMFNDDGIGIVWDRGDTFTVSDDGQGNVKKIYFAPGNLQYKSGETYPWRFAEHQWDYFGSYVESGWVDYFAWGTWTGDNPDPKIVSSFNWNEYQAWLSSLNWDADDFTKEYLLADESQRDYDWYTLSKDEWDYLLNRRTGVDDIHLCVPGTTANGVAGVILFPDAWTTNYVGVVEYTAAMQEAGAVFLPKAGYYNNYNGGPDYVGESCYCWSSTMGGDDPYNPNPYAYCAILNGYGYGGYLGSYSAGEGCSVRLVRDAQ